VISAVLPGSLPSSAASGSVIAAYAVSHKTDLTVSSVVIGISIFVGLLFYGQLRWRLRHAPAADKWATISFGGAVLFAAGGGVSGGAQLALADDPKRLSPAAAQALYAIFRDMPMVLFAGLGVLMFAAGLAILQSHLLPRWLGWIGLAFGIVAVLPLGLIALVLGAAWTLAVSIAMTRRRDPAHDGTPATGRP
jgi:hypothetical protein